MAGALRRRRPARCVGGPDVPDAALSRTAVLGRPATELDSAAAGPDWVAINGDAVDAVDYLVVGREAKGAGRISGDRYLSATHVHLARHVDGTVTVTDLGSLNGTWLGSKRVTSMTLARSAYLRVGRSILRISVYPGSTQLEASSWVTSQEGWV